MGDLKEVKIHSMELLLEKGTWMATVDWIHQKDWSGASPVEYGSSKAIAESNLRVRLKGWGFIVKD